MLHFSGGYNPIYLNFKISNIKQKNYVDEKIRGVLKVLKNILFRGAPTVPSKYLQQIINGKNSTSMDEITGRGLVVFRFQALLVELFLNGQISFENKTYSIKLINADFDSFQIAFNDLKLWLKHLFNLANMDINYPEFANVDDNADIIVDIDLLNTICGDKSNVLYIRNDEYQYESLCLDDNCRNYYNVEVDDFRFYEVDYNKKTHEEALKYMLENIFGYPDFKPYQLEIISKALSPNNAVLGLLPTGSGKSICFQLVSLLTPAVTFVISPLTVLMKDQCLDLYSKGITNVNYTCAEEIEITDKKKTLRSVIINELIKNSNLKIIYISPERIFNKSFIDISKQIADNIGQLVIDEVHCLSEWGHDFRVSYLLVLNYFNKLKDNTNTLLMGTTATAASRVITDIRIEFEKIHNDVKIIRSKSVKRRELQFDVIRCFSPNDKKSKILITARKNYKNVKSLFFYAYKNTAIDYYETLVNELGEENIACYVGGNKTDFDKAKALEDFKSGKKKLMLATKAFGMGVNVPNIRYTYHTQFASSVEAIYQEMGRAGRDGEISYCNVFFDSSMKSNIQKIFDMNPIDSIEEIKNNKVYGELNEQFYLISTSNFEPKVESEIILYLNNFLRKAHKIFKIRTEECAFEFDGVKEKLNLYHYLNKCTNNRIKKRISTGKKIEDFDLFWGRFYNIVDRCLYKLYLLGIIDIWSIDYSSGLSNPTYSNINFNNKITKEELHENLVNYIRRYESDYSYMISVETESMIKHNVIKELCKWSFNSFYVSRWNSLKTLYGLIDDFRSSTDFADKIDAYFSFNEKLERCKDYPHNYNYMFDVLEDTKDFESLKMSIEKFYDDKIDGETINYLFMISCIITNDLNNLHEPIKKGIEAFNIMLNKGVDNLISIHNRTDKYLNSNKNIIKLAHFIYSFILDQPLEKVDAISNDEIDEMYKFESLYELNEGLEENNAKYR